MNKYTLTILALATATALTSSVASADATKPPAPASASASASAPAAKPIATSYASVPIDPASLPSGDLLVIDRTHRPASLPASSKVAGVKIQSTPTHAPPGQPSHYEEIRSAASAKEYDDRPMEEQQTCFDIAPVNDPRTSRSSIRRMQAAFNKKQHGKPGFHPVIVPGADDDDEEEVETWSLSSQTRATMTRNFYPGKDYDDRVQLVHMESFETRPTGPTLVTKNFWVDAETGGARLQREATLPLRDLGLMSTGVHLYAGKTATNVVFLATRGESVQNVFSEEPNGNIQSSNCGHMIMPLALQRGLSTETLFVVQTQKSTPTPEEEANVKEMAKSATPQQLRAMLRFSGSDRKERSGHIVMSTQWEADEPTPLIAFSSGWDTREKSNE